MNLNQSAETLLTNFLPLPENLQKEVIDFAHFLFLKYNPDSFQKNISEIELTEIQKETITKRYEALKADPTRAIPWQVAKTKLFEKYGV